MSLTTEQKINMLILAGFEPGMLAHGDENYPRILLPGERGFSRPGLWRNGIGKWRFECYDFIAAPASWDALKIHTIPDELIYQAIATTG